MAEYLGLTGPSQLPDEGMDGRFIQRHDVWVLPKAKTMKLRVMTNCLYCNKQLPVGRLAQHEKTMHHHEWISNMNEQRLRFNAWNVEESKRNARAALAPTGAAT